MSGGVPKRVLISQTQSNTPSKAGKWGKPGIILCNGARSRRAMCNSIQTRAKYCAVPCTPPVPLNLLLFNTFNDASHNQGNSAPGRLDTIITVYKTPTTAAADTTIVDDTNNIVTSITLGGTPIGTVPLEWNTPQNYAVYDDTVYQDVFSSAYSSVDFNVDNMNGGDTYRFIISTVKTFLYASGPPGNSGNVINPPAYNVSSTLVPPQDPSSVGFPLPDKLSELLQINYGIASQMPPSSENNKLKVPPTPLQNTFLDTNAYYYLKVDVTLSADKKTATHVIV